MRRSRLGVAAAVGVVSAQVLYGQTPGGGTGPPSFDASSIKLNISGDTGVAFGSLPGRRFTAVNVSLRELVQRAYGIQNLQLVGGPEWIDFTRFDIVAKAETVPPPSPPGRPPGPMLRMLQALLTERFKLVVHSDTRDLPIYALVLARSDGRLGPRLSVSTANCAAVRARVAPLPPFERGEPPACSLGSSFGSAPRLAGGGVDMPRLAESLSMRVDRVVLDRTGLDGEFAFTLEFSPEPGTPSPATALNRPSIFAALEEQLGLKLEATHGPVDVLVIDRVERPTPD